MWGEGDTCRDMPNVPRGITLKIDQDLSLSLYIKEIVGRGGGMMEDIECIKINSTPLPPPPVRWRKGYGGRKTITYRRILTSLLVLQKRLVGFVFFFGLFLF